jgi:hypothetical protein
MSLFNLAQSAKLIEAITPQAGGAITGDYVSCKTAGRVFVVVHVNQAAANTIAITIEQASAVAGTGSKAITNTVPIWVCESCAASDALVAQTAAVSYTTTAGTTHKLIVFEVDPTTLDKANGFDCLVVKTGASNAANITSAFYLLTDVRYEGATPPSAIID